LQEKSRLVVSNWVEKFKTDRITLTFPVINHAAEVLFLVTGQDKAPALATVFDNHSSPEQFPAKLVKPDNGVLTWMVGQEAAAQMQRAS
jgi:6-phosphogluconolactonase